MSYCDVAAGHPVHGPYHDQEYGFPVAGDDSLFERLMLEINQAGLSWLTILKKRDAFRRAFEGFSLERVSRFTAARRQRLMHDDSIIRNRLKIDAAIENATRILALRKTHGSFANWLEAHHPRQGADWTKLFRKSFVFTGGEITSSFLLSTGFLPGAHEESCPVYGRIALMRPAWMR
jgi:DNA-3-methyladenine glycosylase I